MQPVPPTGKKFVLSPIVLTACKALPSQSLKSSILKVIHPQQWKDDPKSVEEVTRIWESNPLWYGICHGYNGPVEVFWGVLFNPYKSTKRTHFLGHTQSEVIPRMKSSLSDPFPDLPPCLIWTLHSEPAILFPCQSAVSPPKPRDFRLPEPAILFPCRSAVSHPKPRHFRSPEPAILFSRPVSGFPPQTM